MSFQDFNQFGGAPPQDGGSVPGGSNPQDASMGGQMPEQNQTPFQGGQGGDASGNGGPGGDQKTTLW